MVADSSMYRRAVADWRQAIRRRWRPGEMYILNRIGSSSDPCGTPQLQVIEGDDADPNFTICNRSDVAINLTWEATYRPSADIITIEAIY